MGKGNSSSRAAANNRSNQMNPNNPAYSSSMGTGGHSGRTGSKASVDNRSVQLNSNNPGYWKSRGIKKPSFNSRQAAASAGAVGHPKRAAKGLTREQIGKAAVIGTAAAAGLIAGALLSRKR